MLSARPSHRAQRGLSLVELMVGIAIGLFVVAAATLVIVTQLGNNRRLLLETQLQQDLRATMDIVTRELRRAGRSADLVAMQGIWYPATAAVAHNPLGIIDVPSSAQIDFKYRRDGEEGPYGFKRDGDTIRSLLGAAGWQELTDSNVMKVTRFTITPTLSADTVQCPRACSAVPTDTSCWPKLWTRSYKVEITAQSRHDSAVQRTLQSVVRARNDWLEFSDPGHVCPE